MIAFEWKDGLPRVRVNPTCEMFVHGWGKGEPEKRCGRAATVRVSRMPYWSKLWCPEHAADFSDVSSRVPS